MIRPYDTAVAAHMTEAQLLAQVRALARALGWATYHTLRSRGSEPGWPDLVLARGRRLLFRELKTETGRLTKAQHQWLDLLARTGQDAAVWRPRHLLDGRIAAELRTVAGAP